jgi:hypothetical protein
MEASSDEPVMSIIPREVVLAGDVESVLMGLSVFVRSQVLAPQVQGKWRLHFDGFNDDPRELFQIPEVRRFVTTLDQIFPYWFFLADLSSETLQVIASCVCTVTQLAPGHIVFHGEDLGRFMERQFDGMNQLWEIHRLSDARNRSVSESIVEYFESRRILN